MPIDNEVTKMRDKARTHGNAMLKVLVDIAEDDDAKASARVAAALSVLERGFGAAERHSTSDVNVAVFDARASHLDALKKLAAEPVPLLPERVEKVIEGEAVRLPPAPKSKYEE